MGILRRITFWYKNNFDSDWIETNYDIPVRSFSNVDTIVELNSVPKLVPEKSYMFDKLDEIFSDQKSFTNQINGQFKDKPFTCYNFDKTDFDLYYDLNCAIEELIEAIRELNTKKWKQTRKEVNKEKVLEEIVDATKFINQAILRLGYNANDFYELHKKKSQINRDRQKNGY